MNQEVFNFVVGPLILAIFGFIRWVFVRLHKDMQKDRHALRNELGVLSNKLELEIIRREAVQENLRLTEKLVDYMRTQIEQKDQEIVKLRDLVNLYTNMLIQGRIRPLEIETPEAT